MNLQGRRNITTNALNDGIFIGYAAKLGHNATGQCGGALRLTASQVREEWPWRVRWFGGGECMEGIESGLVVCRVCMPTSSDVLVYAPM
jgi:hypothetical protein